MSHFRLLILALLLFSCKSSKNHAKQEDHKYTFDFIKAETLTDVIETAERFDKLVFLDIYTEWCLPCKMMDEDVYTDERLGDYFKQHFVSCKIDAEKASGPMIADLYDVSGFPTLLFLDLRGRILTQAKGSVSSSSMYDLADEALSISNSQGNSQGE